MKSLITGKEINIANPEICDYWQVYKNHPEFIAGYEQGYQVSFCAEFDEQEDLYNVYDISALGIIWLTGFREGVISGEQDT